MSVTAISVDNLIGPRDTELLHGDIEREIEHFLRAIAEARVAGEEPDETDELALDQLLAFKQEVQQITGRDFDEVIIVPDDTFLDYIREWAEEAYDLHPNVGIYVDWERLAEAERNEFKPCMFGDDQVWVR